MASDKISLDEFGKFRRSNAIDMRQAGMPGRKVSRCISLNRLVVAEGIRTEEALGKALKEEGIGGYFALAGALEQKLLKTNNADLIAVGKSIIEGAAEKVERGDPRFYKLMSHATRFDTLRWQGTKYDGNRLLRPVPMKK